jgi:hypothetical protein
MNSRSLPPPLKTDSLTRASQSDDDPRSSSYLLQLRGKPWLRRFSLQGMTKHQLSGATVGGQPSRPYSDGHGCSDVACHSLSRMPTIEPAIDFPSPPIDHFPDATIDKPWLKAEYDPGLDAASGRMLAMTVKGDMRDIVRSPATVHFAASIFKCSDARCQRPGNVDLSNVYFRNGNAAQIRTQTCQKMN